jgi:hypothetical protein
MKRSAHEIAAAKITNHYERCWDAVATVKTLQKGPTWQLTPGFRILVFSPIDRRNMWTYATCGMSQQMDAPALEIHLFSPTETDSHVELLTAIAHYHLTGAYLDVGHTVNFGRPWLEGSKCDHGLISLPYLDGPKLEWLEVAGRKIRFLWLIPISKDEVEYQKSHGTEALEDRFEERRFNYLDPGRSSVA